MTKFFIIFTIVFFVFGCVSTGDQLSKKDITGSYHEVKPGDSLAVLEKKYHINKEEIKEINGIENERNLKIGQVLFIPDPDPIGKKIATIKKSTQNLRKRPLPHLKNAPFAFPLPGGKVIYRFSKIKNKPYDGLGIKASQGSKVLAAKKGRVLFVGDEGTKFGLLVIIEHQEPYITVYAHLGRAFVKTGQLISRGEMLGTVGMSGGISFPHLHFQVRVNQRPENPEIFLPPS